MARLDQELQKKEEPKRIAYAKKRIQELGYQLTFETDREIQFMHNGHVVKLWPYSGWHSGKNIKDGRGINNLLKQLV